MITFVIIVCAVVAIVAIINYLDYMNRKKAEKGMTQIHKPEELVEVFARYIADDYWDVDSKRFYLDFTKKETRQDIPCWHEKKRFLNKGNEGEGSFWLGDDGEGNDLSYMVHFTQEDWARFSQLYDQHRKNNDVWEKWWGDRWVNLYASISADKEVLERVYEWCHKSDGKNKKKKAASTYLREVLDLLQKGDEQACGKRLQLKKGEQKDISDVEATLLEMGYLRRDYVAEPGQFAIRGSILDVFKFGDDKPIRIDFFGEEIDSIRTFEPQTQQTLERVEECCIKSQDDCGDDDNGPFVVRRWLDNYTELFGKSFTTAEDMLKYMKTFFQVGFWQSSEMQEELNGNYREVLTGYFNNTRQDNPGMTLDLSDAEWKRLKKLFPMFIEEDEMRDIVWDTLERRIGCVIDPKEGRSAKAVVVHDMLEPFA